MNHGNVMAAVQYLEPAEHPLSYFTATEWAGDKDRRDSIMADIYSNMSNEERSEVAAKVDPQYSDGVLLSIDSGDAHIGMLWCVWDTAGNLIGVYSTAPYLS